MRRLVVAAAALLAAQTSRGAEPPQPVRVGRFTAEQSRSFSTKDGLPSDDVRAIAVGRRGEVYAAGAGGLAVRIGGKWTVMEGLHRSASLVAVDEDRYVIASPQTLQEVAGGEPACLSSSSGRTVVGSPLGLFEGGPNWRPVAGLQACVGASPDVRAVALAPDGRIAVACAQGLYLFDKKWSRLLPVDGKRSWAPVDVRGAAFDGLGRLWFASPQGVGRLDAKGWKLYSQEEGLPYDDFTCVAGGSDGVVWFGAKIGAIRFDGTNWNYRQGRRWLPDDEVRSIAIASNGDAWFATSKGVGVIERRPTTLREKAEFFESEIEKYHRRTPYGYVHNVVLAAPGDKSKFRRHDSDNDGLWTGMYGAGECFAYAATKSEAARARAKAAFEALRFLSQVTQGGSNPAPKGFPARCILPTTEPNPNLNGYTPEDDRREQQHDPLWKVVVPRWPTSADGKWYWKSDTSSDELDGHFFFYACYYDLVAETAAEKARVRDVVVAIADHLLEHDFDLIDHDGKPTRWARFNPRWLNGDAVTWGRGLNSLSILSYLKTAEHMTGDPRYAAAYKELVDKHSYAANVLEAKRQNGRGSGNMSDDEMAMMGYYNLLKYEKDPKLRANYEFSLLFYWRLMEPAHNPLFNFIFAARYSNWNRLWGGPVDQCLQQGVDTLRRYPLDRIRWGQRNSHRIDVVKLSESLWDHRHNTGGLRDGRALPIDERFVEYWNHNPFELDQGGDGRELADGSSFLLAYYLGLYHGWIVE